MRATTKDVLQLRRGLFMTALESQAAQLAVSEKDRQRLIDSNEHWHIRVQQLLSDKQNAQDAQASAEQQLAERDAEIAAITLDCEQAQRNCSNAIEDYNDIKAHAEEMYGWIDRVLSCVERAEQDIGGETMGAIIPDGGPIYDAYRAAHPVPPTN
jgi:hypothetical protein